MGEWKFYDEEIPSEWDNTVDGHFYVCVALVDETPMSIQVIVDEWIANEERFDIERYNTADVLAWKPIGEYPPPPSAEELMEHGLLNSVLIDFGNGTDTLGRVLKGEVNGD